jgi:hypothetical protein
MSATTGSARRSARVARHYVYYYVYYCVAVATDVVDANGLHPVRRVSGVFASFDEALLVLPWIRRREYTAYVRRERRKRAAT